MIKPLNDECTQGESYHCPSQLLANYEVSREEEILLHENYSQCTFSQLKISDHHLEIVPEINQYLAVFKKPEKIKVQCAEQMQTYSLLDVFLTKENTCEIIFRGRELPSRIATQGKRLVMTTPQFKLSSENLLKLTIELKKLNFKELLVNPVVPLLEDTTNYQAPSV